ncbi:MAG: hypothetical protein ISS36_02405 [Candidatus Aenigmarchaeota archaeon]|nr:hypothetical protein [Candidatus Aenigmarchaeota archaeon]
MKLIIFGLILLVLVSGCVQIEKSTEMPFGLSNPTTHNEGREPLNKLGDVLLDLGLSETNGEAGFVVDSLSRKEEEICENKKCKKVRYDFSDADKLIDEVVGKGNANLWIVLHPITKNEFTDGKERERGKSFHPDGPVSRQAYRNYLTALINHVNDYGKKKSNNPEWYVARWNLFNEIKSEYKSTFGDTESAAKAYVNFAVDSAEIIRKLSPKSKIVLGGLAEGFDILTPNSGDIIFYEAVFKELKASDTEYAVFDYFENHWFGWLHTYQNNLKDVTVQDIYDFLEKYDYGEKEVLIRAGATYTGIDLEERKEFMSTYQTEHDQAEYLVKKFVFNIANGAKKIPWSTIFEHDIYQGDLHVKFNNMGLIYNGVPNGKGDEKCDPKTWNPCPDPGWGVKKLSYYSFKKLIEMLRGSDWDNIETINTPKDAYAYKFSKNGKTVIVAWWDWWKKCPRNEKCVNSCINENKGDYMGMDNCVNKCEKDCIEKKQSEIRLNFDSALVTETIPKKAVGAEVKYNKDFKSEEIRGNPIKIKLGKTPVYIEAA